MADSEPIVSPKSATMANDSSTHPSTGYDDVNMSAAPVAGAVMSENVENSVLNSASVTIEELNITADMNELSAMANGSDTVASQHLANATNALSTNEQSTPPDVSQTSATDASLNGNNAGDMGGITSVAGGENGIISADVHQTFEGSGTFLYGYVYLYVSMYICIYVCLYAS